MFIFLLPSVFYNCNLQQDNMGVVCKFAVMKDGPVKGVYDKTIDRESAYEILEAKAEKTSKAEDK